MIVAIYVRVSTRKQDETNQLPRLREIAKNRGFEVYHEYSDEASAKDANRPGWRGLMEDASKHRFDAILVTKLDRVMRSLGAAQHHHVQSPDLQREAHLCRHRGD